MSNYKHSLRHQNLTTIPLEPKRSSSLANTLLLLSFGVTLGYCYGVAQGEELEQLTEYDREQLAQIINEVAK